MPHTETVTHFPEAGAYPPACDERQGASKSEVSDVVVDALVNRAKRIISGIDDPPDLVVPPKVTEFLSHLYEGKTPPPTTAALRHMAERLSLQEYYRGRSVAYFRTGDGKLVVLACGGDTIGALLRGLSDDEAAKVTTTDTAD